jgi:hypothetical protein
MKTSHVLSSLRLLGVVVLAACEPPDSYCTPCEDVALASQSVPAVIMVLEADCADGTDPSFSCVHLSAAVDRLRALDEATRRDCDTNHGGGGGQQCVADPTIGDVKEKLRSDCEMMRLDCATATRLVRDIESLEEAARCGCPSE